MTKFCMSGGVKSDIPHRNTNCGGRSTSSMRENTTDITKKATTNTEERMGSAHTYIYI
jgi:hypothetical protein